MTEASVVVPARNAAGTIGRTLDCLSRQAGASDFEVIVVDDGSSDRTVEICRSAPLDVTVVEQRGRGAAEARNRGVAESSGAALAFLDADCFPEPGWLAAGMRALEDAGLVQGQVLPDPEVEVGPFDRTLWVTRETGLWESANLFVTREVFDLVGGFDDWLEVELGKMMAEDVWFGWRARRRGVRSRFCAEALVHHAVFPRGPAGYLDERRRVRYFPDIARRSPEIRDALFFQRYFLSRRSAAFDCLAVGLGLSAWSRSPLPLVAAAPYAVLAWRRRLRYRQPADAALVGAVDALADGLALVELVRGSLRAGSLVL